MKRLSTDRYILIGQTPVPEPDLMKWATTFETMDRIVARTEIGESLVSTIFLGLDHGWFGGPPLLFETMVFSSDRESLYCRRCSTWLEAEEQHAATVEMVKRNELL